MTAALHISSRHMPVLDGLRAVSILLVLASHAGLQAIVPGGLGVVIFFVISGFLITRLMLDEIRTTGELNIRLFYLRRVLRLMPTLILFLILVVPTLLALGVPITSVQIASVLFYLANYYHIYIEYPPYSPFPIFWSLAVEEHFYILFPFLMQALRARLQTLTTILALTAMAMLGWRFQLNALCLHGMTPYAACGVPSQMTDRIFHGTDSIADCILFGALASLLLRLYPQKIYKILVNNKAFGAAVTGLFLTLICRNPDFRETLRYTLQAASIAVIILNLVFGRRWLAQKILEKKPLIVVGRWSYALYMFHFAVIDVIEKIHGQEGLHSAWDFFFYILGSFALAGLSYILADKPLQNLRRRLHPLPRPESA